MTKIQAIVLDSNVFGGQAIPNINLIEKWSSACAEHDVELWIPEVVLHELTQHALEEEEKHQANFRNFSATRERLGFPRLEPSETLQEIDIWRRIEETGVKIIGLSGTAAIAGLLDQIYLRGVGQRKGGIKTGAADSAWVRSVAEEAACRGWKFSDLVIVSGDKRVIDNTVIELQGENPPMVFKHTGDLDRYLSNGLGEFSEELIRRIINKTHVMFPKRSFWRYLGFFGVLLRDKFIAAGIEGCADVEVQSEAKDLKLTLRESNPWLGTIMFDLSFHFDATALMGDGSWGEDSFKDFVVEVRGTKSFAIKEGGNVSEIGGLIDDPKWSIVSWDSWYAQHASQS